MTRALAALAILVAASTAAAQQADVSMSVDRDRVRVGEIFQLTIRAEMNGAGASFEVPDLSAFAIEQQQVSRPMSLQIGIGRGTQVVSQSEVRRYALRAMSEGSHRIAPATVTIGGRTFSSDAITVVVGDAPVLPSQGTGRAPPGATETEDSVDAMIRDGSAFLRTWIDDGNPYVGQQITVSVYLYTRNGLRGSPAITQEPTTDGFWVQDLEARDQRLSPEEDTIDGQRWQTYRIRHFAAFPLRSGELTIGAPGLEVRSNNILDMMRGGSSEWSRTGLPATVTVRELPAEGRPDGDVHVGALELTASVDQAAVETNEAVTLTVTARGDGSLEQLRVPMPDAEGLRVLPPEMRDQPGTRAGVVGGTRTIRTLIIPEAPGTYTLGPFEIPTFDPEAGEYGVARAPAITLTVTGEAMGVEAPPDEPDDEPPAEAARFRPIHTASALSRSHASFVDAPWFGWLFALGPLALLGALFIKRRASAPADPKAAPKRARRAAKQRLAEAEGHVAANEPRGFYAAVSSAIKEVLEAKLGHPVGSLTFGELRTTLTDRGMDEALSDAIADELEGCDFARFSAVGVSKDEMRACLARAQDILAKLGRFQPTEVAS